MDLPYRKKTHLAHYDYGRKGAYFITICTHNRQLLFSLPVGEDSISSRKYTDVSSAMLKRVFHDVIDKYRGFECDDFVIMPNHFHAIIKINHHRQIIPAHPHEDTESSATGATIIEFVQEFKRYSTIEYIKLVKQGLLPSFDKAIWQRSFHDHVIRSEEDYIQIKQYIRNNPRSWDKDIFYKKDDE